MQRIHSKAAVRAIKPVLTGLTASAGCLLELFVRDELEVLEVGFAASPQGVDSAAAAAPQYLDTMEKLYIDTICPRNLFPFV